MQNKLKYLTPVIAALLLSACGRDEPTATYYPAVPYQNPDTAPAPDSDPEMVLPNNEYAPFSRTIFGYGGGVQDVYFDHYRNENYRIRNYDGVTIAFMMRQPYGDYLIVDEYDRILFSLTYTSGDMYRIVDPLGFHYGFLSYNYEGSFVAMDTRQRMYHNVWFMPLYFAYPVRNRYYRYHRHYDWRRSVPPPQHMTNPDDAPKNQGNRRGRKRLDDDRSETFKARRIVANRSRNRAADIKDRERYLDLEGEARYGSNVRPKKRTNYKAKPKTKTNQGQVTKTWSQRRSGGQEDITREENNRARQRSITNAKTNKVRQKQRQQANELSRQYRAPETRQFREDDREADRQRSQSSQRTQQAQPRQVQPQSQRSQQARPQARQQTRQAPAVQQQSRPQPTYQKPAKSSSPKAKSSSGSKPSRNKSSGSSRSKSRPSGKRKVHN